MRNFFILCITALLAVSCSSKKNYTIEGIAPEGSNGNWVYLYDMNHDQNVDSVQVVDGKFSFKGVADSIGYFSVSIKEINSVTSFIPESGTIKVDFSDPGTAAVSGGPLNQALEQYNTELKGLYQSGSEGLRKIREEFANTPDVLDEKVNEYVDKVNGEIAEVNKKYFEPNKDNIIGGIVYSAWSNMLSEGEKEAVIAQMGENLRNIPSIQKASMRIEKLKTTSEGNMFKDFTLERGNVDGTKASLSDYVGKGKYTLVDFWASWCGPCIHEFPTLKEVYETYKGDKFNMVGIAVWDERDKVLKGIEQHGIVWPVIIDEKSNRENTDLYGISGIPQIILFGPDGKIVARDLRGDALKAKIAEVLSQK